MDKFKLVLANIDDDFKVQTVRVRFEKGLVIENVDDKHWKVVLYKTENQQVFELFKELVYSHPDHEDDDIYFDSGDELIIYNPYSGWRNREGDHILEYEYLISPKIKKIFKDALAERLKRM